MQLSTGRVLLFLLVVIALLLSSWLCLFVLSPFETLTPYFAIQSILPRVDGDFHYQLIHEIRLPRVIACVLGGSSLAVAGALMQIMTRNPLASPSLLSVNSGAAVALVLVDGLFPFFQDSVFLIFFAALGGGLSWLLVMSIAWRDGKVSKNRLILSGIAVSAFCAAITRTSLIMLEDRANGILRWLAGGVANVRWFELELLMIGIIPALIFTFWISPKLNLLSLSDESARALGLNLNKVRAGMSIATLFLVGTCVSVLGPISFLGLIAPHLARRMFSYDARVMLPCAAVLGGLLMVLADLLARYLAYPAEIPAGVVIAIVGAPFFIYYAKSR